MEKGGSNVLYYPNVGIGRFSYTAGFEFGYDRYFRDDVHLLLERLSEDNS